MKILRDGDKLSWFAQFYINIQNSNVYKVSDSLYFQDFIGNLFASKHSQTTLSSFATTKAIRKKIREAR